MWNQDSRRCGVACADCHMPYQREGALKISDHHVRSPLLNVNRACQTRHKWSDDEVKGRVDAIQHRTYSLRNRAMDAVIGLIADLKAATAAGRTDAQLAPARDFQRKAQFYLDFVEARTPPAFTLSRRRRAFSGSPSTSRARASWPSATCPARPATPSRVRPCCHG
jgi:nitrite reductase (cytochrome c-552)